MTRIVLTKIRSFSRSPPCTRGPDSADEGTSLMVEQVVVSEPEKEPQSMSERADPRRIAIDRYQLLRVGLLALRAGPLLILVILIGIVVATTNPSSARARTSATCSRRRRSSPSSRSDSCS